MSPRDEGELDGSHLFPALVSLSVIVHLGVAALVPSLAAPAAREPLPSRIELEAPEAPKPPPEPPPPSEPAPPAATPERPASAPPIRATAKPTVLETATSERDVAIDAVIGEKVSMPAEPPPEPAREPVAAATTVSPPPPPPPPRIDPGPAVVPAKSLGRLPRAPALDRELERNYPTDARRAGVGGSATLRLQVLPDGRLGRVDQLSESYPGFGIACERTVRAARWDPPLDRDGRAVATEIKYVCRFEVRS